MSYCTILCDIKNSQSLTNRNEIQYKLINMLKIANETFKDIIVSPFAITTGDEWEGLLKYPCDYLNLLNFFNNHIPEIKFYCGIGIGNISINDFNLTVNQLYGPCFYKARLAINYAKKSNLPLVILFDSWEDLNNY